MIAYFKHFVLMFNDVESKSGHQEDICVQHFTKCKLFRWIVPFNPFRLNGCSTQTHNILLYFDQSKLNRLVNEHNVMTYYISLKVLPVIASIALKLNPLICYWLQISDISGIFFLFRRLSFRTQFALQCIEWISGIKKTFLPSLLTAYSPFEMWSNWLLSEMYFFRPNPLAVEKHVIKPLS